jgi:hypothetical protein
MKIRLMGSELFHADGETDSHKEPNSSFFAILRKRLTKLKRFNNKNIYRHNITWKNIENIANYLILNITDVSSNNEGNPSPLRIFNLFLLRNCNVTERDSSRSISSTLNPCK